MPKSVVNPRAEKLVIVNCRVPRSLRDKIMRLARRDRRTQSDYLRLLLLDAVKQREKTAA